MAPSEPKKTSGLTALGVLSVVLGGVFLLASVWGLLKPQAIEHLQSKQPGTPRLLAGASVAIVYTDAAINLVLAGALLAAGVGLLRLRRWGARLARWYALARIVWSVTAFALALIGPFANRGNTEELFPPFAEYMQTQFTSVALTLMFGGLVLSSVFAVVLLCLLSRPGYRDPLA